MEKRKCDICLRIGSQKNSVHVATCEEMGILRKCTVFDRSLERDIQPYRRDECSDGVRDVFVRHCRACRRLFLKLAKDKDREKDLFQNGKKIPEKLRRSITSATNIYNGYRHGSARRINAKKICYLKGNSNPQCSANKDSVYHPARLGELQPVIALSWVDEFSKSLSIEKSIATEIVQNCEEVRLCSVHEGHMKKSLATVRGKMKRCSLCCVLPDGAVGSGVTSFQWEGLSANDENVCIVQDALAASRYSSVVV